MKISKEWDWSQLGTGFWTGVAVISLVNIGLIMAHHNQFLYDEYILGISIVIIVVYLVVRSRSK
ncbi:hypothetical protein [uncultured Methanoregula sp.]|uniref:hypothetical protein n=1 Tax=uncultured Methanoregula sp. TaxID=1005933 RepID=UPI002AAAF8DF|nr:hypothetical protein [uncultured Methanoregula sp.]